ncbi:MAG: AI-2E family transporter [Ktedonobacteraceae bacterium]
MGQQDNSQFGEEYSAALPAKGDRIALPSPETFARSAWMRRLIIGLTILTWLAIGAVVLAVIGHIMGTLILLIAAGLLAYTIYPLVLLLQRFMPRMLAIVVVYLVALSALAFLLYSVVSSVVQQSASFVPYFQYLLSPQGLRQLQPFIETLNKLGLTQDQLRAFGEQIAGQLQGLITQAVSVLNSIFNVIISVVVIAVLSIYFLLDGERIIYWLRYKMPITQRDNINFLLRTMHQSVGGYFRGLLLLSTIAGVSTGLMLALFGVPYAALLAVVMFVFMFIPVIGGTLALLLCSILSLSQGWVTALIVTILGILLQFLIGQFLAPRIMESTVKIHPIVAIVAMFAGIELLGMGLLGGFIAIPLAGVLQSILVAYWDRWKETHPEEFSSESGSVTSKSSLRPLRRHGQRGQGRRRK